MTIKSANNAVTRIFHIAPRALTPVSPCSHPPNQADNRGAVLIFERAGDFPAAELEERSAEAKRRDEEHVHQQRRGAAEAREEDLVRDGNVDEEEAVDDEDGGQRDGHRGCIDRTRDVFR
jgi:hypothetical protein